MFQIPLIQNDTTNIVAKNLLERTTAQLGRTPNLYRAMVNAPSALEGYLNFHKALASGKLTANLREQIALFVAWKNNCHYCVSAHAFRGKKVGLSNTELENNIRAESTDPKIAAALHFVDEVMINKGKLSSESLQQLIEAGWTTEEMTEMVAHVALNTFSNYFNHVAKPELDFPAAEFHHG